MRIRFVEEYDPIRDTTLWYTEKRHFGQWLGVFSYVDGSCSHRLDEARAIWERIKKSRHAKKSKTVIETVTL